MKYSVIALFVLVSSLNNVSANCNSCTVGGEKSDSKKELFVRFIADKQEFIKPHWNEDYAYISSGMNIFFCPFDTREDSTKDLVKNIIGGDNLGGFYAYSYPSLPCGWLAKPEFEQHIKNREGITSSMQYKLVHKEASNFNGVLTSSKLNSGLLITWE